MKENQIIKALLDGGARVDKVNYLLVVFMTTKKMSYQQALKELAYCDRWELNQYLKECLI